MELERRWFRAWLFMSIDGLLGLHRDLWLRRVARDAFWVRARQRLIAGRSTQFGECAELSYALAEEFSNENDAGEMTDLALWVDHVAVWAGNDRLAEASWSVLVHRVLDEDSSEISAKVRTSIRNVAELHGTRKQEALRRLTQLMMGLSTQETELLERHQVTHENLENSLALTMSCNIFVAAWESCCRHLTSTELRGLQELGQSVGARLGMGHTQLSFPGFWRPRLRRFIDRATGASPDEVE